MAKEKKRSKKRRKRKETFQITGKIAAEESDKKTVGLRVIAHISGTKKIVGSAIVDKDNQYQIEFKHHEHVDITLSVVPDVEETIRARLPKAKQFISKDTWKKRNSFYVDVSIVVPKMLWPIWERICQEYTIFGYVVIGTRDPDNPGNYLKLTPFPYATVHIHDVSFLWYPLPFPFKYAQYEIGTVTTDENGLFSFTFNWCYTTPPIVPYWCWPPLPDTKPDILFKVSQTVNNVQVTLYEEDPKEETRWDVDALPPLGVVLIVEDVDVVIPDDPIEPVTSDFEFHGIGNVLVSEINDEGYADTSDSMPDTVKARDSPFGSTIDVKGQFHQDHIGKYYQILYATDLDPNNFSPIQNESWPVAQKIGDEWVTVIKNPTTLPGGIEGCYEIPDYTDLYTTSKVLLIRWTTNKKDFETLRYPDGKYILKVKMYNPDGTDFLSDLCNIRLDNTRPVAQISENIGIIGGTIPLCPTDGPVSDPVCDSPSVCGIIYVESGKSVKLKFDAYDSQQHFRNYSFTYRTGHAIELSIPGGNRHYTDTPETNFGVQNQDLDWDITGLSQCGYEVRLNVWDRTTNGYHIIHRSEDFIHLILLEKP